MAEYHEEESPLDEPEIIKNEKTRFSSLKKDQWREIEQPISSFTTQVLNTMKRLGSDDTSNQHIKNVQVCGDIYDLIRPLIEKGRKNKIELVDKADDKPKEMAIKKKGGKKANKKNVPSKEQMIINHKKDKAIKLLNVALDSFSWKVLNSSVGFRSDYAEIRIITFIYCIEFVIRNRIKAKETSYELVKGGEKMLENIKELVGVSQIAIQDMRKSIDRLKLYCEYSNEELFCKFPKLCYVTQTDKVFTSMAIKPYKSQSETINILKSNDKILLFLITAVGSGKTILSIAMNKLVENARIKEKSKGIQPTEQLIFCCCLETVRIDVARLAYHADIKFGIATIDKDNGTVKVTNSYNCSSDNMRTFIVADLDATLALLKKGGKYMLVIDEGNVNADKIGSRTTETFCEIMTHSPAKTVLSSGTFPTPDKLPGLVTNFMERHAGAVVKTVFSRESLIGMEIFNMDGTTLAPHNDCQNCQELESAIKCLKGEPLLSKTYTASIAFRLQRRLEENNVPNVPNLETYFSDARKITQTEIQDIIIQLFETLLATKDDALVKKICYPMGKQYIEDLQKDIIQFNQEDESDEEDEEDGLVWEKDEDTSKEVTETSSESFNLDNVFTTEAYRHLNGCLIATKNPVKFVQDRMKLYFKGYKISFGKMVEKYKSELAAHERIVSKSVGRIKNEDEKSKRQQEIQEKEPAMNFPEYLRVNSPHHIVKHAKHKYKDIDKKLMARHINMEQIPIDLNVPDWMMLALCSGIGIYDPNNPDIDPNYTNFVLKLTRDELMPFVVSNESISFGANLPFTRVIIEDCLANEHSMGTLYQLMGRAGRVGLSWMSFIILGPNTSRRFMDHVRGKEDLGTDREALNINSAFDKIKDKKDTSDEYQNLIPINKIAEMKETEKAKMNDQKKKIEEDTKIPPLSKPSDIDTVNPYDKLDSKDTIVPPEECNDWEELCD